MYKRQSIAEGYFAFPKLEGPISNRMKFNGKEVITWSVNDYLGIAWELGVGGNGPHSAIRSFAGPSGSDARLGFLTTSNGGTTLTEGLSVAHNGNVGIGITNPTVKLHVDGGINVAGHIIPTTDNSFDLGSTNSLDFRTLYIREIDVFNQRLRIDSTGTIARFQDHGSVGDGLQFLHLGTEILRLGNGSSTTATFAGDVEVIRDAGKATKCVRIHNQGTAANDDAVLSWQTQLSRTYSMGIHRDSGNLVISNQDASVASSELLTIDASGNVGINVTSISRKFQIDSSDLTDKATALFYTNAIHTASDTNAVVAIRSDHSSSTGDVLYVRGDGTGNLLTLDKGGSVKLVVDDDGNATFAGEVEVINTGGFITGRSSSSSNTNSSLSPSFRYLIPAAFTAEACTKASFSLSSLSMKPYPFLPLYHLILPVSVLILFLSPYVVYYSIKLI